MTDTSPRLQLLMVDDDDLIIQSIRLSLPQPWRLTAANTPGEIPVATKFTAAFVDMHLTGNLKQAEGLDVIRRLHEQDPHLEIVAISGNLDRDLMEGCLKAGASRFLAKPLSPEEIKLILEKIEALTLLRKATLRAAAAGSNSHDHIAWIGESPKSQNVQRQIASLRGEPGPILLEGESGTGKEVAAFLIHKQEDPRPFISVNVAALPENVFESEIFGHIRGAFTGADQNKMGLAEAAHNGDLFLDEIEALPLSQQAKLLRFLESGEIRRVGSKDSIKINVRVIAATNQNLNQMVKEGKFREDLLWRLNGKKILLPPLRERLEDVPALAEYFLASHRPRRNKSLSDDAKTALQSYSFPGNVRELKRICEQISLYSPLPILRREDVLSVLPAVSAQSSLQTLDLSRGLTTLINDFESDVIRRALATDDDVEKVASLLQVSRSTLYKKIKDFNLPLKGEK